MSLKDRVGHQPQPCSGQGIQHPRGDEYRSPAATLLSSHLSQAVKPRVAGPHGRGVQAHAGTHGCWGMRGAESCWQHNPRQAQMMREAAQAPEGLLAAHCSFYLPNSPVIYCRNGG